MNSYLPLKLKNLLGFTMIEMIVVLSLVVISSTIVLFNYRGARQNTTLTSTALDVASMIRLAQNGGRSASKLYTDDPQNYALFQEDVLSGQSGINTTISTGVNFKLNTVNSSEGWISDIIVYKNQNGIFGYQDNYNPSGGDVDVKLEVKTLSSTSPIKLYICQAVTDYNSDCEILDYHLLPGNQGIDFEFTRLQSEPLLRPIYKNLIESNNTQPTIMLVTNVGNEVLRKFIILEKTGNIFVR